MVHVPSYQPPNVVRGSSQATSPVLSNVLTKTTNEEIDSGMVDQELHPSRHNSEEYEAMPHLPSVVLVSQPSQLSTLESESWQASPRNPNEDAIVFGTEAARKVEEEQKELMEMKKKVNRLESEMTDQINQKFRYKECLEQVEIKYRNEISKLQTELSVTARKLEEKSAELRKIEDKKNEDTVTYEKDIAKREEEKTEYEQKITNLEKKNREAEARYEEVVAQREKWKSQFKEAERKNRESQLEIKTLKSRITELEKELGEWKEHEKRKRSVNEDPSTPDEETDWKLKAEHAEENYRKSQAEIKDLKAHLELIELKLENSKQQNEILRRDYEILQHKCEEEKHEFATQIEQMAYDIRNAHTTRVIEEQAAEIEHLKKQLSNASIAS